MNNTKLEIRGRPKRDWVKIDCRGILSGSINYQFTLEEQAVWVKMIAYSAVCGGPPGSICDNDGRGMPLAFIAHELHCPLEILESTINKGIDEGRVKSNGTGAIILTNFSVYQFTEYDRQRPYRQAKKNNESDPMKGKGKD